MRNGRPDGKLEGIQKMISEGARLIEEAKRYYFKARKTLANPGTSSKTYWTLINFVLNKIKIPMIPPLLRSTILIHDFVISDEKILSIMLSLNPNKAHGWDEISARMIKLSDSALVLPFRIIFTNCLKCGLFPEVWKYANVVPFNKKNEKNMKENYRPISLLPIFGKILEKLIYDSLYSHLVSLEQLNPNQSGFVKETKQSTSYCQEHIRYLKP